MRCRDELRGEIEQKLGILNENGMNASTKCDNSTANEKKPSFRALHGINGRGPRKTVEKNSSSEGKGEAR